MRNKNVEATKNDFTRNVKVSLPLWSLDELEHERREKKAQIFADKVRHMNE